METIQYLKTQAHRMNADQRALVSRVGAMPPGSNLLKTEEERLSQLYLWLHMESGSVSHRRFSSSVPMKGRRLR